MTVHEQSERRNANSFDLIRMAAASCVFFGHERGMAGYPEPVVGPSGIALASTGLYIFFALSGYLVCQSLLRDGRARRFFLARTLRIYPASLVSVVFCVALGAIVTTLPWYEFWASRTTWSYAGHNAAILWTPTRLALPGVFQNARWPVVNGSIWTIKYELICYIVLWAAKKLAPVHIATFRTVLLAATVCLIAAYIGWTSAYTPPEGDQFFVNFNTFNLLRFFLVFCAGASYAACEPLAECARLAFFLIPAGLVCLGVTQAFVKAGVILLLTLFAIELGRTPWLFSRSYRRVGDLSYGTFLYAYPIQNLVTNGLYDGTNLVAVTFVSFALVLLCAWLSWRLVEAPVLALKNVVDRRNADAVPQQRLGLRASCSGPG